MKMNSERSNDDYVEIVSMISNFLIVWNSSPLFTVQPSQKTMMIKLELSKTKWAENLQHNTCSFILCVFISFFKKCQRHILHSKRKSELVNRGKMIWKTCMVIILVRAIKIVKYLVWEFTCHTHTVHIIWLELV